MNRCQEIQLTGGAIAARRKKAPSGWVFRSGPIFRSLEVWRNPFPPKGTVCESSCRYCIRCAAAAYAVGFIENA
jgi:hypothetical protein